MSGTTSGNQWAYVYWDSLYERVIRHPKREVVLEALIEASPAVLTRQGLAEEAATRMVDQGLIDDEDEYTANNVDNVLRHLEHHHLNVRSPKFDQDGSFTNMPNELLSDWLEGCKFKPALHPDSLPDDPKTNRLGSFIVQSWNADTQSANAKSGDGDALIAGGGSPAATQTHEALVYAHALEYVEGPTPDDVTLGIGSLAHLRDTGNAALAEDLSVADALPDPDGPFVGDQGVHDYGIFVRIDGIKRILDRDGLQRKVELQLATHLAASKQLFDVQYNRDEDETVATGIDIAKAAREFNQQKQVTEPAIERFDVDTAITEPGDGTSGNATFGIYHRDKP